MDICGKQDDLKKEEKENFFQRLINSYRLIVIEESTYEERVSLGVSPLKVILFFFTVFLISGIIVYSFVALTPMKEVLVPGYTDSKFREDAQYSRLLVDSLSRANDIKDKYIVDLRIILSGGVISDFGNDTMQYIEGDMIAPYLVSAEDSALRAKLANESQYQLLESDGSDRPSLANLFLFKPLNGTVSSHFDSQIEHYGVDIIAPKDEVVKAVLDGTVIMASYTTDGGNVIQIQHDHNMISVYKHNSALFKKMGDPVKAGESIAVIGDTGDHSDGPHLHFEIWLKGVPIDPLEFFVFEE